MIGEVGLTEVRTCPLKPTVCHGTTRKHSSAIHEHVAEPALCDTSEAIRRGDSLAVIAAERGLGTNTVVVELHRHGLVKEHWRRHLA